MLPDIPWGLEDTKCGAHSKVPYLPMYAGTQAEHTVIIDEEDYRWAMQWRWGVVPSKNNRRKIYIRRTSRYQGRFITVYLHKQICLRAHGLPPTASHTMADHKNGQTLDLRRSNLRWVTPSENRQNYNGVYAMQVRLDLKTGGDRLLRAHKFGGLHGEAVHTPVHPGTLDAGDGPPRTAQVAGQNETRDCDEVPF